MNSSTRIFRRLPPALVALVLLALPALVSAHPGHSHPGEDDEFAVVSSVMAGLEHPLGGLDHLLAALAIGWVCAAMGRARGSSAATTCLIAMIAGGIAGVAGLKIPGMEAALGISVLALGLFIFSGLAAKAVWLVPSLMAVGFIHGAAHGGVGPGGLGAIPYSAGFLLSTAALIAAGACVHLLVDRSRPLRRLAGGAVTAAGLVLLWKSAV